MTDLAEMREEITEGLMALEDRDADAAERLQQQILSMIADAVFGLDAQEFYSTDQVAEILRLAGFETEVWMTGGGVRNPIVVLDRNPQSGEASRYLMLSDGWSRDEAGWSLIEEDDPFDDADVIAEFTPEPSETPMSAEGLASTLREWLAAVVAS